MRRLWSCWTTPTRSRRPPEAVVGAALAALALAACSPGAPPGVDRAELDAAVSRAIGDPNSCLLIAEAGSGKLTYRYNTHTACDRELPSCEGGGIREAAKTKLGQLLNRTAQTGAVVQLSCDSEPDGSRGVGWAAGPIAGTDLVYAAMMEGDRAFPGRMMADRLEGAFRRAKVSKAPAGTQAPASQKAP
jgi:hypothetical protein